MGYDLGTILAEKLDEIPGKQSYHVDILSMYWISGIYNAPYRWYILQAEMLSNNQQSHDVV